MTRKKIGLALGGGSARGLAHIGVLKALEKNNIKVDYIAGTSAGAVAGAAYAWGTSPDALKDMAISMKARDWASLVDVGIPHDGGFVAGNRVMSLLKVIIGDTDFIDLKIPFACVACDLWTGEEIVIDSGSVLEGVRASISIPLIFSAVERDGRYLVDGGLINQVPVNVVRKMGADIVVAVNVYSTVSDRPQKPSIKAKKPGVFDVITQVIDIAQMKTVLESVEGADVIISPDTRGVTSADFLKAKELILQGELAGEMAIPEIDLALMS